MILCSARSSSSAPLPELPLNREKLSEISCAGDSAGEPVTVTYLGAGGILFRRGADAILTAPFFSNPPLWAVSAGPISPDAALIEKGLPPVDDVKAILVGHAHYDHLMDVPYIARRRAPAALIYANRAAARTLAAPETGVDKSRVIVMDERAGDHERPGDWVSIPGTRVRVMALKSQHAPHFMGYKFYGGDFNEDLKSLPRTAWGWKEGQTLAFLIDFMAPDGVTTEFRAHYQDAASAPPYGFPPPELATQPLDLAVVCAASFHMVSHYPGAFLFLTKPRHVLLGHWENFFKPLSDLLEAVPYTDIKSLTQQMTWLHPGPKRWTLPVPGTALRMTACRKT